MARIKGGLGAKKRHNRVSVSSVSFGSHVSMLQHV